MHSFKFLLVIAFIQLPGIVMSNFEEAEQTLVLIGAKPKDSVKTNEALR